MTIGHDEEIVKMAKPFEERPYELVRNFKYLAMMFLRPGTGTNSYYRKRGLVRYHRISALMAVLLNIFANVKDARKYMGSDGYII